MKTMHKLMLALAALLLAGTSQGQTTMASSTGSSSLRDNPGVLGHSYTDLNYSWVDFSEDGIDAHGYIAGFRGNVPIRRGLDVGLGYHYYRENNHRNPFTGTEFDARYHQVATDATFFLPTRAIKPFISGAVGYQWSRGDIQSLRTYDSQWIWGASSGVQIPLGAFTLTPRISYTDTMQNSSVGSWHYGAEAHHWFTEKLGGYLDATFHDPRRNGGPEAWTYTAGMRLRF
jgi:hypothetical protein